MRQSYDNTATLQAIADAAESSAEMLEHLSQEHQLHEDPVHCEMPADSRRASQVETSPRDSYSNWVDYVAAADEAANGNAAGHVFMPVTTQSVPGGSLVPVGEPLHDGDLAAELEQSLGFSESLVAYTQQRASALYVGADDDTGANVM
ncbi:hypothetical protein H4R21_006965, partial [Coemansia helicoidea]